MRTTPAASPAGPSAPGEPSSSGGAFASSGNDAFDEYREETLKRLEEEQREFREFLSRLRKAKDKQEFDQFMSERRSRPATGPETGPSALRQYEAHCRAAQHTLDAAQDVLARLRDAEAEARHHLTTARTVWTATEAPPERVGPHLSGR